MQVDISMIGQLMSLKELVLDASKIRYLPDSIGFLLNLESLSLKYCGRLSTLPETIENLKSLRELLLDNTGIVELPHAILELPLLQTLGLSECKMLESMPLLPSSLTDFRFSWTSWRSGLLFPKSINLRELCFS